MEPIPLVTGQRVDPATLDPTALRQCASEVLQRTAQLCDILDRGMSAQLMGLPYHRLLQLLANPQTGEMFLSEQVGIVFFGKRYQLLSGFPDTSDTLLPGRVLSVPMTAAPQEAPAGPVLYASAAQKEEIIRLLNHPVITRTESTKMLLNLNRLDVERADTAIAKLRQAIDDRENHGEAGA